MSGAWLHVGTMASCHSHSANGTKILQVLSIYLKAMFYISFNTLVLPVLCYKLFYFLSSTAPAVKNDASPCASDPTPRPRRHRDPPRHTSGGKISVI